MEASSTRLAILTVGVEEPVSSGQEHWHCYQSASAKILKVTSHYWIALVSATCESAAGRKHCQKRQFSMAYMPGYSRASARMKISPFEGVTVGGCNCHRQQ